MYDDTMTQNEPPQEMYDDTMAAADTQAYDDALVQDQEGLYQVSFCICSGLYSNMFQLLP